MDRIVRIAVVGATGNAGRLVTRLLLDDPRAEVTACGRSPTRLDDLAASVGPVGGRLTTAVADVGDEARLRGIAAGADLVVGATSHSHHGPVLAACAVEAGASYLGIYLSDRRKWDRLRTLQERCLAGGAMVVDDAGCHPGLPGAMIRFASAGGALGTAWVGAKFALNWGETGVVRDTVADFLTEVETTDPSVFVDGVWVRGYRHARRFDFRRGAGPELCVPMCLEEIREVAEAGVVASTGFFIAGFGTLMDYVVLPASMLLAKVSRPSADALFWWGLRTLASAPGQADVRLQGTRAGDGSPVEMVVSHPDPYVLTAVPVVATIRQMLDAPKPGVWTQAGFVDPGPFFRDVAAMGVSVD